MQRPLLKFALAAGTSALVVASAHAGGFSRGTADTDILFDDANFNMRAGATFVAPQRGYESVVAPNSPFAAGAGLTPGTSFSSTDDDYSDSYAVPSAVVKLNVTDDLRCAGSHTISFGAGATYGDQAVLFGSLADGTGTTEEGFETNEFGLTCAYKFDMERGRAWIIGGAFLEDFTYEQTVQFNGAIVSAAVTQGLIARGVPLPIASAQGAAIGAGLNGRTGTLSFDGDYEPGFRIGAAYEIPEIALRAQILYRSEINHNPDGQFTTFAPVDAAAGGPGTAVGEGTLPQSVDFRLQSGIAEGTLAFGSVKWTDWSSLQTLDYTITGGPLPGIRELEYAWEDGWTVTGGLGYAFSEAVSGALSLTWDKGVSTTEDVHTDSYTLAGGVSLKDKWNGELRLGGAVSYLTAGEVEGEANPLGSTIGTIDEGASFGYSVGDDWAYAVSASYKIAW